MGKSARSMKEKVSERGGGICAGETAYSFIKKRLVMTEIPSEIETAAWLGGGGGGRVAPNHHVVSVGSPCWDKKTREYGGGGKQRL